MAPHVCMFTYAFLWQLWRLITPFLVFGKPGYQYLLYFTLLYKHGSELEQSPYASEGGLATGTPADFLYMLIFGAGVLLVITCRCAPLSLGIP